jgi:hypothetical protein
MDQETRLMGFAVSDGEREHYLGAWSDDETSEQVAHVREAQRALSDYFSHMREDSRINNRTAVGRQEIAQRKARESLRKIGDALGKVERTQQAEMAAAAEQQQRALDSFAVPYKSAPWNVHVDLVLAERMRTEASIAGALVATGDNGADIPTGFEDYARACLRLPPAAWAGSAEKQNSIARAVMGAPLASAIQRGLDAQRICGAAARKLLIDASLGHAAVAAVSPRLADLMTAAAQEPTLRPLTGNEAAPVYKAASDADVPPVEAMQAAE